ncbi:uncharacterized protein [Primulina eburnea]|uniref:uncharacterized protein n=1 Tax=Primulina eburnea TaxID=1245227 RepID=UPI003C6C99B6
MEGSVGATSNSSLLRWEYWLQWQVLVCALILILPTTMAVIFLLRNRSTHPLKPADLWATCWTNIHPRFLLFYRAFAFAAMAFLLFQTVAAFGFFVFFFYTQWTFALVMVYFALATLVSGRGCQIDSRTQSGETDRFLKKDSEDIMNETPTATENHVGGFTKQEVHHNQVAYQEQQVGSIENIVYIIYQASLFSIHRFLSQILMLYGHRQYAAGAVILTDIVFWCLLLPFMTGESFQLTLLIGCMHSVNAVFLLIESALNRMPFPWFGLIYFLLWSCAYVVVQWVLHACCFTWWPYPFLELSTPWAPMWYLALGLAHVPCYGLYVLLVKTKQAALSRMFPRTSVRVSIEKKNG